MAATNEGRETRRRNAVGATGRQVGENIRRMRQVRGLSTKDLARELERRGRPILATSITRIEKGARTVDVDDLLTFAVVLRVSPLSLLLPPVSGATSAEATATGSVPTSRLWRWARALEPLTEPYGEDEFNDFQLHAAPKDLSTPTGNPWSGQGVRLMR